jgi:hypothetical protein
VSHRLARQEVELVVKDRKKEAITTKTGDNFLFGDRIAPNFPFDLVQSECGRRFEQNAVDWSSASGTSSGFAWDGLEDSCIPWAALKSAWRRAAPGSCLNYFGHRPVGMSTAPRISSMFAGRAAGHSGMRR